MRDEKHEKVIETIAGMLREYPGVDEVVRYSREFWMEPDFSLAQHGCILPYTHGQRELYESHGYKFVGSRDDVMWRQFKRDVGAAARKVIEDVRKAAREAKQLDVQLDPDEWVKEDAE